MNARRITPTPGMAVGAAFAAVLIGLAPAARADTDLDPFEDLFGINAWTPSADSFLASDPTNAASFDTSVDAFQSGAGRTTPSASWSPELTPARSASTPTPALISPMAALLPTPLAPSPPAWITRCSPPASGRR